MEDSVSKELTLHGVSVCAGIARGNVVVHGAKEETIPHQSITGGQIPAEIGRLEKALFETRQQILAIVNRITEAVGTEDANIFEAHLLVLEDRTLIDEVIRKLHTDKENVESVFDKVARTYAQTLAQIDDPYLRERSADITDVSRRVLRNLLGYEHDDLHHLPDSGVLVATTLSPSEAAQLIAKRNFGVALEMGSTSSHAAILLRSKGIPTVIGLHGAIEKIRNGQPALLDGYSGFLIVEPSKSTLWQYGELEVKHHTVEEQLDKIRNLPAETLDKHRLVLSANFESINELPVIREHGAQGIGLFRTEYMFLNRDTLPTEDEQYAAYSRAAKELSPDPVVIRTVDLGRDKMPLEDGQAFPTEMNPFLGWCSIRYCLENTEMFKAHLCAILRASADGNVKLMFPMVSDVGQVKQALKIVDEAKAELQKRNVPFNQDMEIGAMIEVPSAALTADIIAREVDFFSIGTNDLIQYSLAVDRTNERIAHLFEPTHPSILKLLKSISDAAHANGIWVGLCGEMAADPALTPLLVGLGLDELSANANSVPAVKQLIRSMNVSDAKQLVEKALQCSTGAEILTLSRDFAKRIAPDLF